MSARIKIYSLLMVEFLLFFIHMANKDKILAELPRISPRFNHSPKKMLRIMQTSNLIDCLMEKRVFIVTYNDEILYVKAVM